MSDFIPVKVTRIDQLTPVVRQFTLTPISGLLPGFSAGSHVQVHLRTQGRAIRNSYSLTGKPTERHQYKIAVRLSDQSRGGSKYLHEQVDLGTLLDISRPANMFPIHSLATHHVLIAGGIGITPFLGYIEQLEMQNASFELHYVFRAGLTDAFTGELKQRLGIKLHAYNSANRPLSVPRLLHNQPLGTHIYVCGPKRLLDAVTSTALELGWPSQNIHFESFGSVEPGTQFQATLSRSKELITVAPDESLLEALERKGHHIPNMCRGGVCGQCATKYLSGQVEHRDHFLDQAERSHTLMPCVSRACGESITLDL